MAISKLILNGNTQIDVTDTTATAGDVAQGKYFYGADGVKTVGTATGSTGTKSISITQNGTTTENVADYANAQITTNVPQMQRAVLRPDAVKVETWSYDKLWIADEGNTLPAYSTTAN